VVIDHHDADHVSGTSATKLVRVRKRVESWVGTLSLSQTGAEIHQVFGEADRAGREPGPGTWWSVILADYFQRESV
jgi:hypothetical protein